MSKLEYSAYRKNGQLFIRNRKQLDIELEQFPEGKDFEVIFQKKFSKRSSQQNRYYFLLVGMIANRFKELGTPCTKDDVHAFLRSKFLFTEFIDEKTGDMLSIPKSTTALTKSEFSEYVEKIQMFSAETLDLILPDAGTQTEFKY